MKSQRKYVVAVALMFATVTAAWAREETLDQLKAKLQSAKTSDQPKIAVEIAQLQLKATDKAYAAGNNKEAQVLLGDLVSNARHATDAASESGKHLKNTEIEIRKMAQRLKDIQPTLDIDERPPVQHAIDQLERMRNQLLDRMFRKD